MIVLVLRGLNDKNPCAKLIETQFLELGNYVSYLIYNSV